jgi:glycerol-3-phosphate dehydrogenase
LGWRDRIWADLDQTWDLIIIGGGITGAGILREAVRGGLKALLVEAKDFAYGTSSRSSKLVHGGFRYLRNAQIRITLESVRERELLLDQGRGLVQPLGFLLTNYAGDRYPGWVFGWGLAVYDLMGLKWGHRHYHPKELLELCDLLRLDGLRGGYRYFDAQTDDARLVFRVIHEAVEAGGTALNYARVDGLIKDTAGRVCGVRLTDTGPDGGDRGIELLARAVVNATGAWGDDLREQVDQKPRLRRLRGSHLLFPWEKVPLKRAVSFFHPVDGRPIFIFPWENTTIYGTTDVDHDQDLQHEPSITLDEVDYLLTGVKSIFPDIDLNHSDIQATWAGVRPVVHTGKRNPSQESREHVIWKERGLLTVTGGKLTTFRVMAHDVLRAIRGRIRDRIPGRLILHRRLRVLDEVPDPPSSYLDPQTILRLKGRFGRVAMDLLQTFSEDEFSTVAGTPYRWAELCWAARVEGVVHLEDLLLRRTRVGLLLPEGGANMLPQLREVLQPHLGWDDPRWEEETRAYLELWNCCYQPPSA